MPKTIPLRVDEIPALSEEDADLSHDLSNDSSIEIDDEKIYYGDSDYVPYSHR